MRSLSNRTKRISSNSIKQNHNVGPPVSNKLYQNPGSIVQSPASRVQHPEYSFQHLRQSRNSGTPLERLLVALYQMQIYWLSYSYMSINL